MKTASTRQSISAYFLFVFALNQELKECFKMGNNSSIAIPSSEISVFLSYARRDDEALHFIDPFKKLLTHFVSANTGRDISTFVDRNNIEWGDFWQEEIKKSLLGATVFIPVLSANYLKSKNCRDEFNKFSSAASKMGVTELILPVLLNRAPYIFNVDSKDEIVQGVLELQYEVIEEASLTSADSQEWKQTMSKMAKRFNASYEKAEIKLADLSVQEEASQTSETGGDDFGEDDLGIIDLLAELEVQAKEVTESANGIEQALKAITEVAETETAPQGKAATPKALQLWAIRAAQKFKQPAIDIEDSGTRLFAVVQSLDKTIGGMKKISKDSNELREAYRKMVQALGDLSSVRDQLSGLLQSLKSAEIVSAAVRRSLKPMRVGITLVQDSLSIMEGWQTE